MRQIKMVSLAILFSLTMSLLFTFCSDDSSDNSNPTTSSNPLSGTWFLQKITLTGGEEPIEIFPTQAGLSITISMRDDNTYTITTISIEGTQVDEGTWSSTDNTVTFNSNDPTIPNQTISYALNGNDLTVSGEFNFGDPNDPFVQATLEFSDQTPGNVTIELNDSETKLVGEWALEQIELNPGLETSIILTPQDNMIESTLTISDSKTMIISYNSPDRQALDFAIWSATEQEIITINPSFEVVTIPYTLDNNDTVLMLDMPFEINEFVMNPAIWTFNKR